MNRPSRSPITVVFPMAGQGAHSGYKFKPFVELSDEPVIAAVVRPFLKWQSAIGRFVFVTLAEQEAEFSVGSRLRAIFPQLQFDLVCLDRPTQGPAQTLAMTVAKQNLRGPTIVCDSDHSIDVDPLFDEILATGAEPCMFPIWSLRGENLKSWSVAACGPDFRVTAIAEKELPAVSGDFYGVIGCYYFADIASTAELVLSRSYNYLSQAIKEMIAGGERVRAVKIDRAEFFGDARGLREARARRDRFPGTIFCDLDGTVVEHQDVPRYDRPLRVLPGSREKLAQWIDEGFLVVLTTARPQTEQSQLEQALREQDVPFHRLNMGLPSGPRYVINDRKPSAMLVPQVVSYEVSRNEGITHISIPSVVPSILKRFNGASFADTLLVEDDEKRFVRKRVLKRDHLTLGYAKLRNQYRTLERFSQFGDIVPALYGDHDNSLEYYYDMEYLSRHQPLTRLSTTDLKQAVARLLEVFQDRVYGVKTSTNSSGIDWLSTHCTRKIFPKLESVQAHPVLARLVTPGEIRINDKTYPTLNSLLSSLLEGQAARRLAPKWLSAVHGDLTFENVLYRAGDVRVIDMDGGDFLDAPELDLGKLFQSLISRYEEWAHADAKLFEQADECQVVLKLNLQLPDDAVRQLFVDHWSRILDCSADEAYLKGLFYMGLHLIRMIPFRLRVSEEQAFFALALAVKYIGEAHEAL
jgi:hypothetical protein